MRLRLMFLGRGKKKYMKNQHIPDSIAFTQVFWRLQVTGAMSEPDTGKKYEDKIIHGIVVASPEAIYTAISSLRLYYGNIAFRSLCFGMTYELNNVCKTHTYDTGASKHLEIKCYVARGIKCVCVFFSSLYTHIGW